MDRNQIAGLVVMLLLMTAYFQFFAPEPPVVTETRATEELIQEGVQNESIVEATGQANYAPEQDSLMNAMQKERYGIFAPYAGSDEETFSIENEVLIITMSSKGGAVKQVELKDFKTYDQQPMILFDEGSSKQEIIVASNYRPINISELTYDIKKSKRSVSGTDSLTVSFKLALESGRYIEHKYTLGGTGYELLYELSFVGMDGVIDNQDIQFNWANDIKRVEHALKDSRTKTTINYQKQNGDFDDIGFSEDAESETLNESLSWFSFKQKFFNAGFVAQNGVKSAAISSSVDKNDTTIVKSLVVNSVLPIADVKTGSGNFKYYFGPNNYQITKKVYPGYSENVDLGWKIFRVVNQWLIIPIFNFLENYILNYGIIIIILVFVIKLMLAPLTWKSHMSMAKMKVMKPEIDAIKEKNDGDAQKTQQETMDLYRKAGINPLSGCIPMLLQMPFLLAMFNFFPNSIELRQEAFLWAHDLSTYDSILDLPFEIPFYGDHVSLFTLLMTASTLILTWSNSQMNTQMQGPMKSMQYMMPIMFLFFLNSFSAGLTFYYFISNLVSFGQMSLFKKIIDEDKIRAVMEENRKKNVNKKKSKFQLKLEEAMKSSQEAQKQKGKKKKK
ncbi:MAG: membrane protein insertase YidC [Reichenbachiella sp.]